MPTAAIASPRTPATTGKTTAGKVKGRGCTRNGLYLLDSSGAMVQARHDTVRRYALHPVTGAIVRIGHWRDVAKLEAAARAAGTIWDGTLACTPVTVDIDTARTLATSALTDTTPGTGTPLADGSTAEAALAEVTGAVWLARTNPDMARGRRVPERLADLRALAILDDEQIADLAENSRRSPAYLATLTWLRRALVEGKVTDQDIIDQLAHQTRISSVQAAAERHGLDIIPARSRASAVNQAARTRALVARLVEAGFDEASVLDLTMLAEADWGTLAYENHTRALAQLVRTNLAFTLAADGDERAARIAHLAEKMTDPDRTELRKKDNQIELVALLLAVGADHPIVSTLPSLAAASLAAAGLLHADTIPADFTAEQWSQTGEAVVAGLPAESAVAVVTALGGDPVKFHLLSKAWREQGTAVTNSAALLTRASELAELKRFDALLAHGSLADIAWAHARTLEMSFAEARAIAEAFTTGPAETPATGNDELVARIRSVPVGALRTALELSQLEHDQLHAGVKIDDGPAPVLIDELGFPHAPAHATARRGGARVRAWHPSAVDSATRLALGFGKEWRQYVTAAKATSRKLQDGREVNIHELTYWLPTGAHAREFGTWLRQKDRVQTMFRGRAGTITLRRIGEDFASLTPAERESPVNDIIGILRARGYGAIGRTPFGAVGALLDRDPAEVRNYASRWVTSLNVPSPFNLTARYRDDASGLVGYFLPRHDARGIYLGLLTDCCQYPGSAGASCAWAGHENPMMGFFVVEDRTGTIVAQSWAWTDGRGVLCFDNVERKSSADGGWNADWDGGDADDEDEDDEAVEAEVLAGLVADTDEDTAAREAAAAERRAALAAMDPAERRAWAIRRVYVQAAKANLDRFTAVTVGTAMTKIPLKGFRNATGDKYGDITLVGYNDYRDSRNQALIVARRRTSTAPVLTAIDGGFRWAHEATLENPNPATVDVVGDRVVLRGDGAIELARTHLAQMGPRTWTVVDGDGNPVADPTGADWMFTGPDELAVPGADVYTPEVLTSVGTWTAQLRSYDRHWYTSAGIDPDSTEGQAWQATGLAAREVYQASQRNMTLAQVTAYPMALRPNAVTLHSHRVGAETAERWLQEVPTLDGPALIAHVTARRTPAQVAAWAEAGVPVTGTLRALSEATSAGLSPEDLTRLISDEHIAGPFATAPVAVRENLIVGWAKALQADKAAVATGGAAAARIDEHAPARIGTALARNITLTNYAISALARGLDMATVDAYLPLLTSADRHDYAIDIVAGLVEDGVTPEHLAALPVRLRDREIVANVVTAAATAGVDLADLRKYPSGADGQLVSTLLAEGVRPGAVPKKTPNSLHVDRVKALAEAAVSDADLAAYAERDPGTLAGSWGSRTGREGRMHVPALLASYGITPAQANAYPPGWKASHILTAAVPGQRPADPITAQVAAAYPAHWTPEEVLHAARPDAAGAAVVAPEAAAAYPGARGKEIVVWSREQNGLTPEQWAEFSAAGITSAEAEDARRLGVDAASYPHFKTAQRELQWYLSRNEEYLAAFARAAVAGTPTSRLHEYSRAMLNGSYARSNDALPAALLTELVEADVDPDLWYRASKMITEEAAEAGDRAYRSAGGSWARQHEAREKAVEKVLSRAVKTTKALAEVGVSRRELVTWRDEHRDAVTLAAVANFAGAGITADTVAAAKAAGTTRKALHAAVKAGTITGADVAAIVTDLATRPTAAPGDEDSADSTDVAGRERAEVSAETLAAAAAGQVQAVRAVLAADADLAARVGADLAVLVGEDDPDRARTLREVRAAFAATFTDAKAAVDAGLDRDTATRYAAAGVATLAQVTALTTAGVDTDTAGATVAALAAAGVTLTDPTALAHAATVRDLPTWLATRTPARPAAAHAPQLSFDDVAAGLPAQESPAPAGDADGEGAGRVIDAAVLAQAAAAGWRAQDAATFGRVETVLAAHTAGIGAKAARKAARTLAAAGIDPAVADTTAIAALVAAAPETATLRTVAETAPAAPAAVQVRAAQLAEHGVPVPVAALVADLPVRHDTPEAPAPTPRHADLVRYHTPDRVAGLRGVRRGDGSPLVRDLAELSTLADTVDAERAAAYVAADPALDARTLAATVEAGKDTAWVATWATAAPAVPAAERVTWERSGFTAEQAQAWRAAAGTRPVAQVSALHQAGLTPDQVAVHADADTDLLLAAHAAGLAGKVLGGRAGTAADLSAALAAGVGGDLVEVAAAGGHDWVTVTDPAVRVLTEHGLDTGAALDGVALGARFAERTATGYRNRIASFRRSGLSARDAALYADLTAPAAAELAGEGCDAATYAKYLAEVAHVSNRNERRRRILRWFRTGVTPEQLADKAAAARARARS